MDLHIYSDESGVFDRVHNEYYVYGGLIFLGKNSRDNFGRKYIAAEKNIAKAYPAGKELKACHIKNKHKLKLYNATRECIRFGGIIYQPKVHAQIFVDKKSKQRYLDYAYKLSLKNAFKGMSRDGLINLSSIEKLFIYADEHTTATNGRYELRETLLQEFKIGTFNFDHNAYYAPIFTNLKDIELTLCNSEKKPLIRAADIVANRLFYRAVHQEALESYHRMYIKTFP